MPRHWLALDEEIKGHDAHLDTRTPTLAPEMVQAYVIGTGTAAEMLILAGDNPERIRPKAMRTWPRLQSWAEPARSIPASCGKTNRHRRNRGGNRQANAALYLVFVTPMRGHQPTLDYLRQRKAEGNRTPEIIRCLNLMIESAHEIVADDPIFVIPRGR